MATNTINSSICRVILRHWHLAPLKFHIRKSDGISTTHLYRLAWLDGLIHNESTIMASFIFHSYISVIQQSKFSMKRTYLGTLQDDVATRITTYLQ